MLGSNPAVNRTPSSYAVGFLSLRAGAGAGYFNVKRRHRMRNLFFAIGSFGVSIGAVLLAGALLA